MLPGSQHFRVRGACWIFEMATKTSNKRVNYSHRSTQTKQQVGAHSWNNFFCMDESRANTDSQNSPRPELEKNHHLPSYIILYASP
jgi:hypothetical protein